MTVEYVVMADGEEIAVADTPGEAQDIVGAWRTEHLGASWVRITARAVNDEAAPLARRPEADPEPKAGT